MQPAAAALAGGDEASTVSASISQSFDFAIAAFTAPARPLLTPAAAQESLVGAPSGTPPRTRVDSVKQIAVPMVNGWRERGGDQQNSS
jgi:hypothetical protein